MTGECFQNFESAGASCLPRGVLVDWKLEKPAGLAALAGREAKALTFLLTMLNMFLASIVNGETDVVLEAALRAGAIRSADFSGNGADLSVADRANPLRRWCASPPSRSKAT